MIRLELAQTLFDREFDVFGRRVVFGIVVLEGKLGRQEDLRPSVWSRFEVSAEHLLAIPVHVSGL